MFGYTLQKSEFSLHIDELLNIIYFIKYLIYALFSHLIQFDILSCLNIIYINKIINVKL